MMKPSKSPFWFAPIALVALICAVVITPARTMLPAPQTQQPALEEWKDEFDGIALDEAKWERFKIEGGDVSLNVREGQLQLSGADGSRAGIRSKRQFNGDRFVAEATVAKVAAVKPQPFGNAIITLLFDDAGRNRIEWLINDDGKFEAWDITNGKNERFDDRQAGTKAANPKLGIARRGDDFYFTVNDQVQLQRTIPNLPTSFRVMLYGFSTSQNDWASARILIPKQIAAAAPAQSPQSAPPATPGTTTGAAGAQTAMDEWGDDFNADKLDETKWERYTFDGGSGGKSEVKDGQLRQRGVGGYDAVGSRAGVRSKKTFRAENFYVEATLAKAGLRLPGAGGGSGALPGLAILTVMFEGNPANRIEWLMTSDGRLEAWDLTNGKSTRLDNQNLGTREKSPRLGIARRGNEIMFMLNGQTGLQKTITGISPNFKVMLYGFATSENNWDAITVQTVR
ncbi:MAG: hypothetical protein MSG64_10415 [Pyrinomonadaceae bacterium MAG19_C2-C3]|nr:hypothetical protein [Pyrinomonadaceae bacterium MAG19_C2-C3]